MTLSRPCPLSNVPYPTGRASSQNHPQLTRDLILLWFELARQGLRAFEYRINLRPLMIGMHIVWRSHEDELRFYKNSSHLELSRWSMRSPLTSALILEHFTRDEGKALVRLGGFYVYEREDDLPQDSFIYNN